MCCKGKAKLMTSPNPVNRVILTALRRNITLSNYRPTVWLIVDQISDQQRGCKKQCFLALFLDMIDWKEHGRKEVKEKTQTTSTSK